MEFWRHNSKIRMLSANIRYTMEDIDENLKDKETTVEYIGDMASDADFLVDKLRELTSKLEDLEMFILTGAYE